MMAGLRRLVRFPALILMVLIGLTITIVWFPFRSRQQRRPVIARWSRILMLCCGVRCELKSEPGAPSWSDLGVQQGYLLLANHVSWLDIFVINQSSAARFVAKSEIRDWPVVGLLVKRVGTLFIERGRRRAVHHMLHEIADHLQSPDLVAVFPEGTTSDGNCLLPFHGNLIQAAISTAVPVLPVGLRYCEPDPDNPRRGGVASAVPLFIGDTTFLASVWQIAGHPAIVAQVTMLAPITPATTAHRHEVASEARQAISQALGLALEDTVPEGLTSLRG
ncbi:MAG: lysophospholipid acyltransferase family protein [Burkholderiaceae bacterium]